MTELPDTYEELTSSSLGRSSSKIPPNFQSQECDYYIEFTLNYPRTKRFENYIDLEQKRLYFRIFNNLKAYKDIESTIGYEYFFETCKSGDVHMHGYLHIRSCNHIPIVEVKNFAKMWLHHLPRSHSDYNPRCLFPDYWRYRSPSICVQYTAGHNTKRIKEWNDYIKKYADSEIKIAEIQKELSDLKIRMINEY